MIIDSGIVTGSLQISGSLTGTGSATFDGLMTSNAVYAVTSVSSPTGGFGTVDTVKFQALSKAELSGSTLITGSLFYNGDTLVTTSEFNNFSSSVSGSYLPTAGGTITGNLVVNGTASISYLNTVFESASVIYSSGSNVLGDASNDVQTLYGTVDVKTGPLQVTGSVSITNTLTTTGGIIGNLTGTASYAISAQTAVSASYASNTQTALSASYTVSASHAAFAINADTASYVTTAQTASYVQQAQNAYTASLASNAENANTASYVTLAQSASYVLNAQNAYSASTALFANTASYVLQAQGAISASYATVATTAYTASSADSGFVVRGIMGVGGPANGLYQVYVTSSIDDGTFAIDTSGTTNAFYFLKGGLRKFEISTAGDGTPITQLLPYTSSGIFRIGNPSNASTDLIFLSEPTGGRVILGPGITTNQLSLSGSEQTDLVQFTGDTFISGGLTVLNNQYIQGTVTSVGGFSGSLAGNATTATTAIQAPYYVLTASYNTDSSSLSTRTTDLEVTTNSLVNASGSFSTRVTNLESFSSSLDTIFATDAQLNAATASLSSSLAVSIAQNTATGSSLTTASSSFSTRTTGLESTASVLTSASASFATQLNSIAGVTGSYATTGSNQFKGNQQITGSLIISSSASTLTIEGNGFSQTYLSSNGALVLNPGYGGVGMAGVDQYMTVGYIVGQTAGSRLTGSFTGSFQGALAGTASFADNATTAVNAPFYVLTASYSADSSSLSTRTTNLESTASVLTSASASFATQLNSIAGVTGSYATTGSNTFDGTQNITNTTNATAFTSTAALYTDGGLRVTKDAYVSGALYVAGNFTVYGTSSINYVTTSVLVGLEFINLNTDLPALRYAGINVGDSGSAAGISSSFWYDSDTDNWLYVHAHQGSTPTSSLAINGPITFNDLGNEQGLTGNYLTKAQVVANDPTNNHHITSSQIYDDGTTVAIAGNLQVTGSLYAGNLTGSLNGSNLVNSTVTNAKLQNSAITIAGTSTSLGGSITAATILSSTGVFSGSAQIPAASITNAQLANSTISGIALGSNLATLTIGTGLSGTSYNGSTGVTIANTGVTSFNTRTGGVTLQASDISGLGAGIFSGSAQVTGLTNANLSGTAGITNANLANSSVTVTAGSGLSGGGAVSLGSSVTLTNAGVTSNVAGTGISVSGATGAVTITNSGVTSAVAGTGVSVSGATGAVTISIGQSVATSATPSFDQVFATSNGLGTNFKVGDDAWIGDINVSNTMRVMGQQSNLAGYIAFGNQTTGLGCNNSSTLTYGASFTATGDVTAYSDRRVKENIETITGALDKVLRLRGVTYTRTDIDDKSQKIGFIAQEVQEVVPEVVTDENDRLSLAYGNLGGLFVEAFKEQQAEIEKNKAEILELKELINTLINK